MSRHQLDKEKEKQSRERQDGKQTCRPSSACVFVRPRLISVNTASSEADIAGL